MIGARRIGLLGGGNISLLVLGAAVLIGMALGFALLQSSPKAAADSHVAPASLVVNPTEVNFNSRSTVWIYGAGLEPGTEVGILLLDSFGVWSDISYVSEPYPAVANEDGAVALKWVLDRWTRDGVGAEGLFTIRLVDRDFNEMGTAPIALCNHGRAEGSAVPAFCSK